MKTMSAAALSLIAGLSAVSGFAEEPQHSGRTKQLHGLECYLGCSEHALSGHVIVKSCAKRYASFLGHLKAEAAQHARECSVIWDDPGSQLGLLVDDRFFQFDTAGTAMAKEVLAKAADPTNTVFRVSGKVTNRGGGWISLPWTGIPIIPAHRIKVERIVQAG